MEPATAPGLYGTTSGAVAGDEGGACTWWRERRCWTAAFGGGCPPGRRVCAGSWWTGTLGGGSARPASVGVHRSWRGAAAGDLGPRGPEGLGRGIMWAELLLGLRLSLLISSGLQWGPCHRPQSRDRGGLWQGLWDTPSGGHTQVVQAATTYTAGGTKHGARNHPRGRGRGTSRHFSVCSACCTVAKVVAAPALGRFAGGQPGTVLSGGEGQPGRSVGPRAQHGVTNRRLDQTTRMKVVRTGSGDG